MPEQAMVAAAGAEVEVLDSRRLGGAWVLDQVWRNIGIGAAVRRVAAGRRLDGDAVERVLFHRVAECPVGVGIRECCGDVGQDVGGRDAVGQDRV
ncbi:MAG: hypothetical protein WCF04_14510 [Candidatus Nanopelagicales bacterium]